ncbi:hypothetical protein BCT86_00085 [Vibrio breoganii]|uniref:glycosyltransferase n=1 Tax=Vibrio breoganii TaxID=553239 RepID=UPI000C827133|nr:glycosyltransferase [Vibrio breoganii]PML10613.1 hypothetical protein BCT86_00085 [Vibrio breoganii]
MEHKVSIITICYENMMELEQTLTSIRKSIYDDLHYEVIVIDGSIKKPCNAIVKIFQDLNIIYVNEKDRGIYDGMNKGLDHITGSTVIFMNSGDVFFKNFSFVDFINRCTDKLSDHIVFGDVVNRVGSLCWRVSMKDEISSDFWWKNKLPSHQSMFIPSFFFRENRFDSDMSISADTKLNTKAFSEIRSYYYGDVVSVFELGGVSSNPGSIRSVNNHYREQLETRNIKNIARVKLYVSLVRRMVLIRMLGLENYYRLIVRFKKLERM